MWVKICANTNYEDAQLAAELGADAVGFVFAPSRRQVTPEVVAAITARLPENVERVGVFDCGSAAEVAAVAERAGLTGVQLHGEFPEEFFGEFERENDGRFDVTRVMHWAAADATMNAQLAKRVAAIGGKVSSARVLLDTSVAGEKSGGTGVAFAWSEAARALAGVRGSKRIIVAGGLRPETVAEAIRALTPWGVDVASGVETTPGKKDAAKLEAFLKQSRSV